MSQTPYGRREESVLTEDLPALLPQARQHESSERQDARPSGASLSSAGLSGAWLNRLARRLLLPRLESIRDGRLTLIDGDQRWTVGERARPSDSVASALVAEIQVHDPRFYGAVAFGGAVGAGEAYIYGWWTADDLVAVVRILARNRDALDGMERGTARLMQPLRKLFHFLHRNTRAGSRRNIAAHYDLGNDFYRLFLDPTLMYSCALFAQEAPVEPEGEPEQHSDPDARLHQASLAKLDLICRKLQLQPDDEVVEIGTGWGGFAVHAAEHYGCRVTTTTISAQQYDYAVERVRRAGLEDRVTVIREDYRDLVERLGVHRRAGGGFDKLVSIEMIEAVGHKYLDAYFATVSTLLKPDGMALIQAITMADDQYERYRHGVDFIQRYIFPGSLLPSVASMSASLARASDLRLFHLHDITPHYALTLHHWRRRFFARLDEVRALGFSEDFRRMWDYYFCYCEGAFDERVIGDVQLLLTKPRCRRTPIGTDLLAQEPS